MGPCKIIYLINWSVHKSSTCSGRGPPTHAVRERAYHYSGYKSKEHLWQSYYGFLINDYKLFLLYRTIWKNIDCHIQYSSCHVWWPRSICNLPLNKYSYNVPHPSILSFLHILTGERNLWELVSSYELTNETFLMWVRSSRGDSRYLL